MSRNCTGISFEGKHFFIGIDVHRKKWKVTIRFEDMELKTWSKGSEKVIRELGRGNKSGLGVRKA